MKSSIKPLITIGVPTYGREEVLVTTIEDLLNQNNKNIEIIVADQTDRHEASTLEFFKSNKDKRLKLYSITPPSLPAARNFIIDKSRADIILFVDDDIRVGKDFVDNHLKTFAKHKDVSFVAGRVKQKGLPLTHELTHFDKYGRQKGWFNCPDGQYATTFPGGNFSAYKKALKKIGGFETSYKRNALREESDCAMRAQNAGYSIYFNPDASILHLAAPMGGCRVKSHQYDNIDFYKNDLLFVLRFVDKKLIPISLIKQYIKYVWHDYYMHKKIKIIYKFILRNAYFATGLVAACTRILFKSRIVAREVIK